MKYSHVYKNDHQAGMITDDPHLWTKALQMYTRIKDVKRKFILHLAFNEIKRIAISIKLITGIINIKRAHIKEWVANEFDSVKKCAGTLKRDETPPLVPASNDTTNKRLSKLPPAVEKMENSTKEI